MAERRGLGRLTQRQRALRCRGLLPIVGRIGRLIRRTARLLDHQPRAFISIDLHGPLASWGCRLSRAEGCFTSLPLTAGRRTEGELQRSSDKAARASLPAPP